MSAEEQAKAARESARASLLRMAKRDAHYFGGFVASWLAHNLTLEQLAALVEQLDRAIPEPPPRWTDTGSGAGYDEDQP